jgi:hypothetical protein
VTATPGQLRDGDTIVERLDDAAFNAKGTAVKRIQIRPVTGEHRATSGMPWHLFCWAPNCYSRVASRADKVFAA